ncbi:MAG TPA: NAD(P)-dependent oxidoreductase [Candidatus Desulfobacillus sp.]|nr:NAD(P)-dependent oxidoreductase [Candidatus Desulfobacillus sp.]
MKAVGIAGTGTMGRAVAGRLLADGLAVSGYDASPRAAEQARALGVAMCGSLAQLAGAAERIILFLPGPAEIAAAVTGEGGLLAGMRRGGAIIDMSTSSPDNTAAMAAAAREAGIGYLDAPVLGRPDTVGKWSLPVGGEAALLEEVRPLLERIAGSVLHVGGPGAGHKVKLLNNLMFGAISAITAEVMAVAERVGVSPAQFYDIVTASQAATVSGLFRESGRRICEERYTDPTFTLGLMAKDVRLGVDMAEAAGAPILVARSVDYLAKVACAQGFAGADTAALWQCVKNLWKP